MSVASKPNQIAATPALDFADPMVVVAPNWPTGLPRSIVAQIPDTPAGNRVRKGFQAIAVHDWNVAQSWFRDALNHDPGNAGIQRLIELADYTMDRERHPPTTTPPRTAPSDTSAGGKAVMATLETNLDNRMDADLAKAFDDFNRNYLPKHPGFMNSTPARSLSPPSPKSGPAPATANWNGFFDALFVLLPKSGSVSEIRN